MIHSAKRLDRLDLQAADDRLGHVRDLLLDRDRWTVRYLVVDTGGWLTGRRVVVSPASVEELDWDEGRIRLGLTKEQVENSPLLDEAAPLSRTDEERLVYHYGWPFYWGGAGLWGTGYTPYGVRGLEPAEVLPPPSPAIGQQEAAIATEHAGEEQADPHLLAASDLIDTVIQGEGEEVGHVAELLLDDESWAIRYLVIDTGRWLPGKKFLVPPDRLRHTPAEGTHLAEVDLATLRAAPEWNQTAVVERAYEQRLHAHFGWEPYWENPRLSRYERAAEVPEEPLYQERGGLRHGE